MIDQHIEDRSRSRRRWVSLSWALGLALWAVAVRGQGQPVTEPDFDVVNVDLTGQLFTNVMPFDVPFILEGALPAGAIEIEVYCTKLQFERGKGPDLVIPAAVKAAHGKAEIQCWEGGPRVWRNVLDPASPPPKFRVLIPPIEAEQYYQFLFQYRKQVSPAEAKAFAEKVQTIVGSSLWQTGAPPAKWPAHGTLLESELQTIHDELSAALREVTGAERVVVPGSVFDPDAPFATVRDRFNGDLRPIRQAQGQIAASLENYDGEADTLGALLASLPPDQPLLAKLQAALAGLVAAGQTSLGDEVAALKALASLQPAPAVDSGARASLEKLVTFRDEAVRAVGATRDALGEVGQLLASLAAGGARQELGSSLTSSGALSAEELVALVAMADNQGLVGKPHRAAGRALQVLTEEIAEPLSARQAALSKLARDYETLVGGAVAVAGSTTGGVVTQFKNYASFDAGIAWVPEISEFSNYVGMNLYTRPVNKAAALSQLGNFRQTFSRRFSFTIGLTLQGVGDGKTREDLFNNQSLVLGVGLRLTGSVRITAGAVVFLEKDPNPLVDDDQEAVSPFLSLSLDVDVLPALKGVGSLFRTQ
ncbi:MAG TPA: hypothetical protein VF017_09890 [Thermoanaerobaculia bacterium]|nr:hypothetical protein [Thermoanaerobaculia bacterium]